MITDEVSMATDDATLRARAVRRLKKRREFQAHLLVYALFNTCVVLIWVLTGADGFFWPVFLIAFWGIGVVMNGWDAYHSDGFPEEQINREMAKLQPRL